MWLREDVQRTAWIANTGQEPCSRDVERSELAGAAGINDPVDRGFVPARNCVLKPATKFEEVPSA